MLYTSYHTHNTYCDGANSIEEMVQAALALGLEGVGISSHSPVPFDTFYAMSLERLADYCTEVRQLQRQYAGRINVWLGLELDYLPEFEDFFRQHLPPLGLDYMIGSVHYVGCDSTGKRWPIDESSASFVRCLETQWGGDIGALLAAYYQLQRQMAASPGVAVIGHLDRIKRWNFGEQFFSESEAWYIAEVEGTLQAFAAAGVIVELNTAYGKLSIDQCYPSPWILRRCVELGVPLTISSDAHSTDQIAARFPEAVALLQELGCTELIALEDGRWVARGLRG